MEFEDFVDIQAIGEDDQFFGRVFTAGFPPVDRCFGGCCGVARVDPDPCPASEPVGRALKEAFGSVGVGQDDAQVAVVLIVTV